ncbi:MAG: efflux RND transporter periplasmic adaptor subunit [Aureliella sp.]
MNQTADITNDPPQSRAGTLLGSIIVIVVVLAILAAIAFAKSRQIAAAMEAPPPPEMPVAVSLSAAEPISFRLSSVVVGTVLASESIVLQTELTGLVTSVPIRPGDTVSKGDVLVQLDDRTERAKLKSAEAALKLAKSELVRMQELARSNAISDADLDVTEAEAVRAAAVVDELKVQIDRKQLKAPFDAQVGLFDLHVGQYLVAGSRITTLEGVANYLHVDFSMPAHVADSVKIGDEVGVLVSDGAPVLSAEVIALDSAADPISRALMARAILHEPPAALQPKDSVRVTVYYGHSIDACSVLSTAVRRSPTGTVVFVAEETESGLRAQSRNVIVGGGTGSTARIVKGVSSGELVVADGSFKVTDGTLVADASAAAPSTENPSTDNASDTEAVDQ